MILLQWTVNLNHTLESKIMKTNQTTLVKCTSCDELLSKPVFIKGLPYGTSCAKKQIGKGAKAKQVCHSFEVHAVYKYGNKLLPDEIDFNLLHTYKFIIIFDGRFYDVIHAKGLTDWKVILSEEIMSTGKVFKEVFSTIGGNRALYDAVYRQ